MTAQLPTPEALALSANIFTAQIASWIPASFGRSIPSQQAESDWQAVLRGAGGDGKERLGLGHPDLGAPKAAGYGAGIKGLEKSLKRGQAAEQQREAERDGGSALRQGNGQGQGQGQGQKKGWAPRGESESEEEESRSSMVGKKRKGGVMDLLNGKGKKKAKANGSVNGQVHPSVQAAATSTAAATLRPEGAGSHDEPSTASASPAMTETASAPVLAPATAPSSPTARPAADSSTATSPQAPDLSTTALPPVSPSSPARAVWYSSSAPHPLLLSHDSKLSKNARKKARQRAKKAAANGET